VKIKAGYDIAFQCAQDVPMLLMLSVRPERQQDLLTQHRMTFSPDVRARDYLDAYGNICTRLIAPRGQLQVRNRFIIADTGEADEVAPDAEQWDIDRLPSEALVYLLGSRYCDTQKLSDLAYMPKHTPFHRLHILRSLSARHPAQHTASWSPPIREIAGGLEDSGPFFSRRHPPQLRHRLQY
jgi:hypothetical protein